MNDPENELIPIPEVRERVPSWPYSPPRTYQLARGIGDGRPALATVRIGKRRYVTRRALAEFLEARLDDTPSEPKRLSPETLAKRRATRAANRAAKESPVQRMPDEIRREFIDSTLAPAGDDDFDLEDACRLLARTEHAKLTQDMNDRLWLTLRHACAEVKRLRGPVKP